MNKVYIGVDIAKATFTAAIVSQTPDSHAADNHPTPRYVGEGANTAEGCRDVAERLGQLAADAGAACVHLLIEPTGGYEARWVAEAYRRQWLVTVVNPQAVRAWAQSRGRRAKNDRQDALMLAQFGAEANPPGQEPVGENVAELDSMLRRQTDLEKLLRSERNRLGQLASQPRRSPTVEASVKRLIETIEAELAALDAAMRQLFVGDETLNRQLKQLLSVPGIGRKTAPYLLTHFHRFQARTSGKGTAKQLVAFLGLDPAPYDSGTTVRKRAVISRKGDSLMRSKLFVGALGGVRGKNRLREVYTSLLAHNKAKKLALVACSRKMLVWAWAVFTNDTLFDSSHFDNKPLPA